MSVCVVYLENEPQAAAAFELSYRTHAPGYDHFFARIIKGIHCSRFGYGMHAWRAAVRRYPDFDHYCCLTSWSEILCDGWLSRLMAHADPNVGMIGCTSSWESFYTNNPNPLRKLFFHPFPNPHIRSTAFVMPRQLMHLWPKYPLPKQIEYLYESGRHSITRQILRRNLACIVVGKSGAMDVDYKFLHCYRQVNQDDLLIGDRRTKLYIESSPQDRAFLSKRAWG